MASNDTDRVLAAVADFRQSLEGRLDGVEGRLAKIEHAVSALVVHALGDGPAKTLGFERDPSDSPIPPPIAAWTGKR